jgi:hypothetical protein
MQQHLTKIEGATPLTWHRIADIQAVRFEDGSEALFIDGVRIKLDPVTHLWPTQQVIALCHLKARALASAVRKLKAA